MEKTYEKAPIKVPRFKESEGFYTSAKRSKHMAKIKSKNTKPEVKLRQALYAKGFRYRIHNKKLPGNPDLSNKAKKVAIFVDGEFWHGYNWAVKKTKIKANRGFWIPKIERNMQRDHENNAKLGQMGFRVFRFWEHEIKKDLGRCVGEVLAYTKDE